MIDAFNFSSRIATSLPNLRRLKTNCFPDDLDPQLVSQFKNLEALNIRFDEQTISMLKYLPCELKELEIRPKTNDFPNIAGFFERMVIFDLFPNLENFSMMLFGGTINLQVSKDPQQLKLKKLALMGDVSFAGGFLPLILASPLLEEVNLCLGLESFASQDIQLVISNLELGTMFQNVTKVKLNWCDFPPLEEIPHGQLKYFVKLAKSIVAFSPKLQRFQCNLDKVSAEAETNNSVHPFFDLVKVI